MKALKLWTYCLVFFFSKSIAAAQLDSLQAIFDQANAAYTEENYTLANEKYQALIAKGVISDDVHYNLGNSYFKQNNIPQAVLHFEKALKINPSHEDAEHNLTIANEKTIDKIERMPDLFIYRWWKSIYKFFYIDQWAKLAVMLFFIALIAFVVYLYFSSLLLKKIGFYSFVIALFFALASCLMAVQQKRQLNSVAHGIITIPTVNILSAPSIGSSQLFVLHEGSKVKINNRVKNWIEIQLPNGNKGWLNQEAVSEI